MDFLKDITHLPPNSKIYNGNTRKFGITIDNTDYIVKFPKDNDMSVYCEYIASAFIRGIGISCHEVVLGKYRGVVVNLIKDFTSNTNLSLHSYKDTKQSSEDTEIGDKEYTYDDILYLMDRHLKMTEAAKKEAKEKFWDMFICDAILGNRDRHWGNWGYLSDGSYYRFAPLYDNGAGLFPGVNKVIHQYKDVTTRKKFLYDRVFIFPASLFKIRKPDRSYRSNCAEMFKDLRINRVFAQRVSLLKKNTNPQQVLNLMNEICSTVPLAMEYKRFYAEIVTLRYMCIILRQNFERSYQWVEEALKGDE